MKYFAVVSSFALVLLAFACKKEIQIYRIGALVSQSGEAEAYGRNVKNGLLLALEEINGKGGIKGKKMDIIFEDDASDEKVAKTKVLQLIKQAKVPVIIGGIISNVALAIAPICDQEKVVLISPTASSPKLSGISQYFFRNFPSDTLEGRVMAEYAVRRMKVRKVAILYIDNEYGEGITKIFSERFTGLGGSIAYQKGYPEGTTDFKDLVKEIKAGEPDGIYLPGYWSEIGNILKEIQAQKVTAKMMSTQGIVHPMILDIAEDAAEGVVYPQPPYDPESKEEHIQHFVQVYKAKYPTTPDQNAALAYDTLMIVARAIAACGPNYPQDLREKIADTNYRGVNGDISFDANGDVDIRPKIFQIKGGQFVPLE